MMRGKAIPTTKWGTACAQCATAKAKCSGRSSTPGSKCDRTSSSSTTTGENPAFDSIVSTPENPPSPSLPGDIDDTTCSSSSARSRMGSYETGRASVPDSYFFSTRPHCLNNPSNQINSLFAEGRDDLDEVLLTRYRTQLMPLHPFVIIPDHVPATVLKAHRPFLMLTIRMVAGFESLNSMRGQMQLIMDHLSERMFRQAERSLDLLMGIVVVLGWYHYHCMKHSQLNNLLCLAESLVSDLGLNRRPAGQMEERAIDEKRLLLGVWYLRSSAAMYLQQLTSMPFTSYMRQCLVDVQQEKEHFLDHVLVYYLKVQYLTERVAVLMSPQVEQEQPQAELSAAMASSQEYFDKIMRDMPESLKNNPSNIETSLRNTNAPVRAWFESWVKQIPLSTYRSLPSSLVFQLLYAVGSLVRSGHEGRNAQEAAFRARSVSPSSTEAIHILDRLVALSLTAPDMANFWAALGEGYDELCSPSMDNFSDPGDEAPSAPMGWMEPNNSPPGGLRQTARPVSYHGSLFIPPSRVGSVGPSSQEDYQVQSHTSVPMLPVSGSMTHLHPTQWVTEPQTWDHHTDPTATSWQASSVTAPQMMITGTEDLDPQLWMPTTTQGGSTASYAEGDYYHHIG
ncbi:hypothetical protein QBC38DRAFT_509755 [Podospora fimiseda]|uniref:Transcription factor domain-containing protein n=1 Tax=Podospora fimiseda TaxID=252190 RepID=A0AAN7BPY4_9PEZI|nr:hypothetical protein QBC38DRAFT_509755 [Podospora fimiseda]